MSEKVEIEKAHTVKEEAKPEISQGEIRDIIMK